MAASKVNAGCAETQIVSEDLLLVSPFRMMITGPSSSGKSTFILNLIKHRRQMFAEQFGRILYFRPHNDDNDHTRSYIEKLRNEFYDLEVMVGLPEEGMCGSKDHSLVIIDDLAPEIFGSKEMLDFFTRQSHHERISIIFTCQHYFSSKVYRKEIINQLQYQVLFSMPADRTTMQSLSRSITGKTKTLGSIMSWILKEFRGVGENYVLVNLHMKSQQHRELLLRTAIFPRETPVGTVEIMPVLFVLDN